MRSSTPAEVRLLAISAADLFRTTWPRHTSKQVARAANSPVATAKAWVASRFTPSADTLLRMAAANTELRAELIRRLEAYGYADTNMVASRAGDGAAPMRRDGGAAGGSAGSAEAGGVGAPEVMR